MAVLLLLAGMGPALPGTARPAADTQYLSQAYANIAGGYRGSYGVYFSLLETGEEAGFHEDKQFCAASCHKLFLVDYIYELAAAGSTSLDKNITYTSAAYEQGAGEIRFAPVGTAYTVRQLCKLAITKSDNIASNLLKRIYGYDKFRRFATSIGCPVTGTYDGRDMTTAREQGIILRRIADFAATNPLGQEIIQFLKEDVYRSRIPAGVPAGVPVGNKEGDYQGYANDAAVIFMQETPYILVVLSSGISGDAGHVRFSRFTYNYLFYINSASRFIDTLENRVNAVLSLLGIESPYAE
jgi:beta-lactamase class A